MRRTRPDAPRRERGLTLIETVVGMVIVAAIVGGVVLFLLPLRQATDVVTRATLTDNADNALQRIGRDVRGALPNSVRTTTNAGSSYLEFLPVRSAGRYRFDPSGGGCDTAADAAGSDELAFGVADSCFKSIGTITNSVTVVANDWLVLNNYGPGYADQDAYLTAGNLNRARITAALEQGGARERINFVTKTFDSGLHASPGRRFYVVNGNAANVLPEPITYECNPTAQTLTRYWGYTMLAAQPSTAVQLAGGNSALVANGVGGCAFDYTANAVAPQIGLLTLRLTLSRARSDGAQETVSLYQAIHVNNVP